MSNKPRLRPGSGSNKPRYRGILNSEGRMELKPVQHAPDKPRYRAELDAGTGRVSLHPISAPAVPQVRVGLPGAVESPEAEVLRELGNQERGGDVEITYFPTRTSNPEDPRTAAAGYDRSTRTLRVEWGDGGPAYNYYNVEPAVWQRMRKSASPGRFINRVLNNYTYGPS